MRSYNQKISKNTIQCVNCGLMAGHCICDYTIKIESQVEFWLLTHENELTRTSNTGRLIERAMDSTKVFVWSRTEAPKELMDLMTCYNVYLVFSDDREDEKARVVNYTGNDKKTAFLIIDGTWKEARKILRKSPYLKELPIVSLRTKKVSSYDLRRNKDDNHLCTVEVAIELLKLIGEKDESLLLDDYFKHYMKRYHDGKYEHNIER